MDNCPEWRLDELRHLWEGDIFELPPLPKPVRREQFASYWKGHTLPEGPQYAEIVERLKNNLLDHVYEKDMLPLLDTLEVVTERADIDFCNRIAIRITAEDNPYDDT